MGIHIILTASALKNRKKLEKDFTSNNTKKMMMKQFAIFLITMVLLFQIANTALQMRSCLPGEKCGNETCGPAPNGLIIKCKGDRCTRFRHIAASAWQCIFHTKPHNPKDFKP